MTFEWDEFKRYLHFKKHGIDFEKAIEAFYYPMVSELDTRENYGEDRWRGTGMMGNILVTLVFADKENGTLRIISARRANKGEKEKFLAHLQNRLG